MVNNYGADQHRMKSFTLAFFVTDWHRERKRIMTAAPLLYKAVEWSCPGEMHLT